MLTLKIKRLRPGARLPLRVTSGSSGLDLFACLDEPLELSPDPVLVPTGIAIEVPPGYDVQIRPRSSLSAKGVGIALGTIDSDYRGEVLVTMYRFGTRPHRIVPGDRIAQLVVTRLAELNLEEVEDLTPTERGTGGHGSTGA